MTYIPAKDILLQKLVEHFGGRYAKHSKPHEAWYYSPFRPDEKTPSFKINEANNRWYDFGHVTSRTKNGGIGSGGDTIDLWCDYHNIDRRKGFKQALQGLESFCSTIPATSFKSNAQEAPKPKPVRFSIIKLHKKIFYQSLKEELNRRQISLATASTYLQQAFVKDNDNPNRKINGFAFANDKGGYELSIPNPFKGTSFKTGTKPKYLTTIEGKDQTNVMVFEGFWDFLTWLEINKVDRPPCTTYILNSVSFTVELIDKIIRQKDTVKFVSLFLDNDDAGFNSLNEITLAMVEAGITCGDMSETYKPHKDINEYWTNTIYQKLLGMSENKHQFPCTFHPE